LVVSHFGWVPRADLSPVAGVDAAPPAEWVLPDPAGEVYTL